VTIAWVDRVSRWYLEHGRTDLPWRGEGVTPWAVLVSEVMLQQTQVSRVAPRLTEWLERWPTPRDLADAPASEVLKAWGRLGYPRRALALQAAARAIADEHDNQVPADLDALLALPGIGHYTARAVAVFAYGQRHPVVDTNVRRVVARVVHGQALAGPPATRRDLADTEALLPDDPHAAAIASVAIMELGAIVCIARSPLCDTCPIADACAWRRAGHPAYAGPVRARQARFDGSDRQVRGRIMAILRDADIPVPRFALEETSPDPAQVERALAGLIADGLAVEDADGIRLP